MEVTYTRTLFVEEKKLVCLGGGGGGLVQCEGISVQVGKTKYRKQ